MKTQFYLISLIVFILFVACDYIEVNSDGDQGLTEKEFSDWVNKFDPELAEAYWENLTYLYMHDARFQNIKPFSIEDVVTYHTAKDVQGETYHTTKRQGITSVYYGKKLIFKNSWGKSYMSPYHMMTEVDYEKLNKIKLLLIRNHSTFLPNENYPEGYHVYEKKLFAQIKGELHEYDLKAMDVAYSIWDLRPTTQEDVVLIKSSSFIREYPRFDHYTFIYLPSKKFRTLSVQLD